MTDAPDTAVERADIAVTERATDVRHAPPVKLLGRLAKLADQPPLLTLSAAVLAAGLIGRDRAQARAGGRMLAAELTATLIKAAVKHVVERARPHALVDDGEYRFAPGDRDESRYNSFPSGHTAGAVAVTRALAREYPASRSAGVAASVLAGAIQVPTARHYASDVVAGVVVGWLAEALVHRFATIVAASR